MSLTEQKEFLKEIHPFSKLNDEEINQCISSMDIAYYPKDTTIISPSNMQDFFFLLLKAK